MTVKCLKPGCCKTWPRDPVLEVKCPTCGAEPGRRCKRPSEHTVWGGEPHPERDRLADRLGHYGPCPFGRCGLANVKAEKSRQLLELAARAPKRKPQAEQAGLADLPLFGTKDLF